MKCYVHYLPVLFENSILANLPYNSKQGNIITQKVLQQKMCMENGEGQACFNPLTI